MRKLLILLLALLAIAAIAYFCVYKTHVPAIQADIAARAKAALSDNGISSIDVNVDGRDITLIGNAISPQIKQAAERIAQVKGYNFIDNQIKVAGNIADGTSKTHSLTIRLDESGKITLNGILDVDSHKKLHEVAIERYGKTNVEDRILELDVPIASGMPDVAILMMQKLSALTSGEAKLIGKVIEISGTSPSPVMISQIEHQLKNQIPKSYTLALALAVSQGDELAEKPANRAKRKLCQKQFNSILRSRKVRFNSSSAVLKNSSYKVLNKIAARAKKCTGMNIKIHGHTDSTGRNSLNRKLSKKRARAVANYLADKGILKTKLLSIGHGSSKPIASNNTNKGRARNRRIELTVESIK
ncbi:MAG: OmpA family protein [Thiotrichaceae bacterium]